MRTSTAALGIALGLVMLAAPKQSSAQIGIGVSIRIGPPALPVYTQPPCPMDGYLWTPGYWAYGDAGYYWVPGVWVAPPRPGVLWTPGYWGFNAGVYGWHGGYWGPHVGFYGGVNYGFGFDGVGFVGGVWAGNVFRYNSAVLNVNNTVVHNVYVDRTVIHNTTINRVAYNGGPGGIQARPTPQQQQFMHEQHIPATSNQMQHEQAMSRDPAQRASANGGRPATVAMDKVGGSRYNPQGRPAAGAEHANAAQNRPSPGAARPNAEARPGAARPNAEARPAAQNRPEARPNVAHNAPQQHAQQNHPAQHAEAAHNKPAGHAQEHPHEGKR